MFEEIKKRIKESERRGHKVPPARSLLGRLIVSFGLWLCRNNLDIEVFGLDNIPRSTPYVIIANHVTFIDALWIFGILPPDHYELTCSMIGEDLNTEYGLLGKLMFQAARAIPVDRKGLSAARSLITAKNALESGNNVLIHPEGTRSANGRIQEFLSGSAYLGHKYDSPVLPIYIEGAYEIWPRQNKYPSFRDENGKPRKLRLHVGPCFYSTDYKDAKEMNMAMEKAFRDLEERLFRAKQNKAD